jgi:RNA polymerase-binding transcription factor DksA
MTTKELKHTVIDKVKELEDDNLLNDLIKLIDDNSIDNDIYQLSDNHKAAIDIAIKQIENGDYLTNEQSNKEIDEWLNK